jgi:HEAT repeat protein
VSDAEEFDDDKEVVFLSADDERKDKEVIFLPVEDERKDKEVVFLPAEADPPPGPPRRGTGLRNASPSPGPKPRDRHDDSRARPRRNPGGGREASSTAAMVLGIVALLVGLSQFILCAFSPSLGYLSIPITALGFLLGGCGLVIGISRKGGKAFPIFGLAVNAVGLTVVLLWSLYASAPAGVASGGDPTPSRAQPPATVAAIERPQPAGPQPVQLPVPVPVPKAGKPAESVAKYREDLKSADAEVRRAAAAELKKSGPGALEALPELVAVLRDSDPGVRADAAETLATLGSRADKAYVDVLRATTDSVGAVTAAAERYLKEFSRPPAESGPGLIAMARDASVPSGLRVRALAGLAQFGPEPGPVVPAYFACLESSDAALRVQAVRCLGTLGRTRDTAVLPRLLVTLNDPDKSVQDAAAEVVQRTATSDVNAVTALQDGLKSDSVKVRTTSLNCLRRMRSEARAAATDVSATLRDRDKAVRLLAAETLFSIAPERLSEAVSLLADGDREVRKGAAVIFRRRLDAAKCLEVFADELATADDASRNDLAEALDEVEIPSASDVPKRTRVRLAASLNDLSPVVRLKAAKVLQRLGEGPDAVARALHNLLGEPGDGIARQAAETLGRMGASATHPAAGGLLRLLDSRDAATRRAGATALRSAGPLKPDAIASLVTGLDDAVIHDDVATLLAEFGDAAVPSLVRALDSKNPVTRRGAAKALGAIGPKAAEGYDALKQRFYKDPDPLVHQEVDKAMGLIRQKK